MLDIEKIRDSKAKLQAELAALDHREREAGGKAVVSSDTSHKNWKDKIFKALARLDPEASTDPKLAIWFDVDKFGGSAPIRAIFIRRFVNGDFFTGKGKLPSNQLNNEQVVDDAIKAALEELRAHSNARPMSVTAADRAAAEERLLRKDLEVKVAAMEAQIQQLLESKAAPAPSPTRDSAPAPAPKADPKATPKGPGRRGRSK